MLSAECDHTEATALLENGHQVSYHVYNKRLIAILQSKWTEITVEHSGVNSVCVTKCSQSIMFDQLSIIFYFCLKIFCDAQYVSFSCLSTCSMLACWLMLVLIRESTPCNLEMDYGLTCRQTILTLHVRRPTVKSGVCAHKRIMRRPNSRPNLKIKLKFIPTIILP